MAGVVGLRPPGCRTPAVPGIPTCCWRPAPQRVANRFVNKVVAAQRRQSHTLGRLGKLHLPCSFATRVGRKNTVRCSSKPRSGFLGHQLQAHRLVHAFSCRHANRVIVCATLVEDERVAVDVEALLDEDLVQNPQLTQGTLSNGLKYVILPNAVPPNRFEAHLEVHAGSVDEGEAEQGVAHLVEHVTFLGSKKREELLGTGARSNAYTDFHHTVFHVHSPLANGNTGTPMLPQVLDALTEIAFEPEFLANRIEKERRAVLAEAQMMNTIEYRVDCQLLQYLHEENALGFRFPIGKTEQVKQWPPHVMKGFWERWYFPANATLYVVGQLDRSVEQTVQLIEHSFSRIPAAREPAVDITPSTTSSSSSNGSSSGSANGTSNGSHAAASSSGAEATSSNGSHAVGPLKQRHPVRPPVEHRYGTGALAEAASPAQVKVFRHRLLQHFMLSLFCKVPVKPITKMRDLRRAFMVRILLSVLQFRVNGRYVEADPPFIQIELDSSDSAREGCTVSTLTITSEPNHWRGAIQVAVQEVRRLQKYGVTAGEMQRYKAALLRDSEQLAGQAGSVPSLDNLDFLMENLALGHTVMDQRQGHAKLLELADTITEEEVNAIARSLLSYISHYRHEDALLAEAAQQPGLWAELGPCRATAIVACIPAYMDKTGHSTGGAAPMQRGASLTTSEHIDPAEAPAVLTSDEEEAEGDVPEGAVRLELEAPQIEEALAADSLEVEAAPDIEVPDALLSDEEVERLIALRSPHFVPLAGEGAPGPSTPPPDPHTRIVQRRLSNGVRLNYCHKDNEPAGAMLRMVASGGRALEGEGAKPGVVTVGTRTLSESGRVGSWAREQVELFCISKLINCMLEADEEFICMDFHFAVGDGGVAAVLQLLHLFLEAPCWDETAMARAKQMYSSHYRSLSKSLERASADRIMSSMLGPDRRFRDPTPEEIEVLTLEEMRTAVMAQLHAGNIEINVVGDFDAAELEDAVLRYMGTISPHPAPSAIPARGFDIQPQPLEKRRQVWHLKDSDERACAYIAGRAPNRWGCFSGEVVTMPAGQVRAPVMPSLMATPQQVAEAAAVRRAHPLYASVTLGLMTEIVNSRLFTTVRDALGLTYDVSFEVTLFDRLPSGWYVVNVTSTPEKIHDAMAASLRVLRTLGTQRITARELSRAKRTVLTRHESDLKDNAYWLGLMTHLQADSVAMKSLDCLRDLVPMYEAATIDDIYDAYAQFNLAEEHVFTCVGTSGRNPPPPPPPPPQLNGGAGTAAQPQDPRAAAMLVALQAAAHTKDFAKALQTMRNQQGQQSS